jgi:excisionase family DNA binding protein
MDYANDYLTVKQAAEYVGVCEKTIRNYIKSGILPAKRRGPRIIVIDIDKLGNLYSAPTTRRTF